MPAAGIITMDSGKPIAIKITPFDAFKFSGWTLFSGKATFGDINSASTTITLCNGDAGILVNMDWIKLPKLTVTNDGHGTTTPKCTLRVAVNGEATVSATPASGYAFSGWTTTSGIVDFDDSTKATTRLMFRCWYATIKANFRATSSLVKLTMTNDGHGTTTPASVSSVKYGTAVAINAKADSYYAFSNWTVTSGTAILDNANKASTTVKVMSNTATLKANFKSTIPAVCLLTVNNDGHGTTSSAGLNYVVGGAAVSIFATPASGYEFSSWAVTSGTATLDNASKSVTTVKVYSLKATIMANFKVKVIPTYQLTITNDGHGTTTPTGVISVKYGVLTAIKANPASGYEFLTWSQLSGIVTLDSLWTRASNTAKLFNGNVTLRANFKARAKLAKSVAAKESASALPNEYGLNQNYPNPFNPSTLISFAIPSTGSELGSQEQKQVSVSLNVYDMRGQLIKNLVNESVTGGLYAIAWDGKSNSGKQVASGQYLCKIISGNFTKEIRMTLMK